MTTEQGQKGTLYLHAPDGHYYAIPLADVEQYQVPDDQREGLREPIAKACHDANEVAGFAINWPWDYIAYSACFYGAWAGGGDAVKAGDYCHDRHLK